MNIVSIALLALGVLALRIRTRRYIVNVATILLAWQVLALLVGPGVAARSAIDEERARPGAQTFVLGETGVRDAMMTSAATTAISLAAWPFLLIAALRRRDADEASASGARNQTP